MIFGKEMAQPSIVFTGKKGLACIKEIMNAKPLSREYVYNVLEQIEEEDKKILENRLADSKECK